MSTATPTAPASTPATDDRSRWVALVVLCVGMLMIVLDVTVVNVALPSMQDDLGFSQSSLAWVVNAYLIAFGGLLLLAGRLGDLISRRGVFLAGLAIFTLASLACGLAQSQEMLVAARFVQGIGGALTSAVILGMIVTMFPEPREQAKAIGVYGFVASAGGSIGLLVGGVLTESINWHWIFFVNIPIGILTAILAVRFIEKDKGIGLSNGADVLGALLVTSALMLLVYTIVKPAAENGWGDGGTLALIAVSVALLVAFLVREATAKTPLIPLRIFRSRNISGANLIQVVTVAGMFGMFFMGSLYLQKVLGYNALQIGLAFLPGTIIMGVLSLGYSHKLVMRFGPRTVMLPGLGLVALGFVWFTRAPVDGSYLTDVLPVMVAFGVGGGVAFPALMMISMSDAAPSDAGLASGLVNTTAQVGGALGLAILATLATTRTTDLQSSGESLAVVADRRLPPRVHARRRAHRRRDRDRRGHPAAGRRGRGGRGVGGPSPSPITRASGPRASPRAPRRSEPEQLPPAAGSPSTLLTMASTSTGAPAALLAAARSGDENAYRTLVEPHSRELHAHAYRMLGSVHDAEDAIQDAMLRAWRGLPKFDGRSSLRAWLYKIATNTCLDTISSRGKRALPIDHVAAAELGEAPGRPLVESVWIEPCDDASLGLGDGRAAPEARYEQRESVELAFIAALQHLPANQRAVLILREVLGFSAQETAELLETTVASVNSAMQRARKTIEEKLPSQSQQETLRAIGDERLREVVEGYMDAMGRGDVEAVVAMLAEDAAWSMPPMATWYLGHESLRQFLIMGPLSGTWRWAYRPGDGQRPARDRRLHVARGRGLLPPVRARRPHAERRRREDRPGDVVHRPLRRGADAG